MKMEFENIKIYTDINILYLQSKDNSKINFSNIEIYTERINHDQYLYPFNTDILYYSYAFKSDIVIIDEKEYYDCYINFSKDENNTIMIIVSDNNMDNIYTITDKILKED